MSPWHHFLCLCLNVCYLFYAPVALFTFLKTVHCHRGKSNGSASFGRSKMARGLREDGLRQDFWHLQCYNVSKITLSRRAPASSDGQTGRSKKIPEVRSHCRLPQPWEMNRYTLLLFSDKETATQNLRDLHKITKPNTRGNTSWAPYHGSWVRTSWIRLLVRDIQSEGEQWPVSWAGPNRELHLLPYFCPPWILSLPIHCHSFSFNICLRVFCWQQPFWGAVSGNWIKNVIF